MFPCINRMKTWGEKIFRGNWTTVDERSEESEKIKNEKEVFNTLWN